MKKTLLMAMLLAIFSFNCGDGCGGNKAEAAGENPCAGAEMENPCAAAENPCAAEAENPCEGESH